MKLKLITALILAGISSAMMAADKPVVTVNATSHFIISGMHCDGCAGGLTAELKETRGIAGATVTFSNKLAIVAYDTNQINAVQLTKVIKDAGFEAKPGNP